MWFSSARKARRISDARSSRPTFRPRIEALEDRYLMSAGALDPSFGNGGLVTGPILPPLVESETDRPAIALQADGNIVASGYVVAANGYKNFALASFNGDGSLDTTFGPNHTGIVSTAVGARDSWIDALAIGANGNIVAVGHAINQVKGNSYVAFAVARYTSTGSLDSTFGNSGIVLTNFASVSAYTDQNLGATSVVIQSDGKIDVAGTAQTVTVSGKGNNTTTTVTTNFALTRYNTNGSLNTGFGSGGIVLTPQFGGGGDYGDSLTLQADGKIILAGSAPSAVGGNTMAIARYTVTGQLDTGFNGSGISILPNPGPYGMRAHGVVVQNSGAIVVAGLSNRGALNYNNLALARLTTTGQMDATFGSAGTGFVMDNNVGNASTGAWTLRQDPNGDLLTCGTIKTDYTDPSTADVLVKAFLPNGVPDTTFATGGVATAGFSGIQDTGKGLAIQSDGKILAVGYTFPAGNSTATIELARFQPPNTKITSFTASPSSGTAGDIVTLTVSGIFNSNPSSTITNIVFYLDAAGGTPLANDKVTLINNNNGTWRYSFDTTGLASGTHTLYAQAVADFSVSSDPVAVSLMVN